MAVLKIHAACPDNGPVKFVCRLIEVAFKAGASGSEPAARFRVCFSAKSGVFIQRLYQLRKEYFIRLDERPAAPLRLISCLY